MLVSVYFSVAGKRYGIIHVFILPVTSLKTLEVLTNTVRYYYLPAVLNRCEV